MSIGQGGLDNFRFREPAYHHEFESRDGIIGKDLEKRATRVQLAAKRQVGKDTHRLELSIVKRWDAVPGRLIIRVGSDVHYALMHHDGTRPHIIRPRAPNGVLRFVKDGQVIFAKLVHHPGTKPNRYLSDNLPLALV